MTRRYSMQTLVKILLTCSLLTFQYIISSEEKLEGNWIGASNPEMIINLSIKDNNFIAHEIDFSTNQLKDKVLFTFNLSENLSQSSEGKSELVLIEEDTLINADGQILYRDYRNKNKKMMCMSDWSSQVPRSMLKRLNELRQTATKHCLKCNTDSCEMKIWPEGNEKEALLCKRIFCQPIETIRKNIFGEIDKFPSGKNSALFHYSISKNGEIKDIKVQEIIGSMNKKQAYLFLSFILKRHKYKELIIKNQKFGINNLRGVINWKLDKS